ncbi:MAG: response regulator transcription factor [Spirochaetales bacterium]|nr:response regulator transcription factor [Spirochaetales bacterium]
MIRVLVADDHALVRQGLREILSATPDIRVVAEAEDQGQTLAAVEEHSPDVVLLDISMPGRGGLDTLKEIRSRGWRVHVLVLSMHPEEQYAVRAIRAGAAGYVTKGVSGDTLADAIRTASTGKPYITPTVAEQLASHLSDWAGENPHEQLSDREFQVLILIASGTSVTQAAAELSLSVQTVSTYRSRILQKMRMRTNAELTHYAVVRGLVT